jgi:type IV pilus assembly protein PilF
VVKKSCIINILLLFFVLAGCSGLDRKSEETAKEGEIHLQMGINYLHDENWERAHFELTKAVRMIPKNPDVHFALGTVNLLRGDIELAIAEFTRTIELDRSYADAYNNLGSAYLELERWDQAIEASSKALEQVQYETPEKALTIMGWAHYRKGDPARAVDLLGRALEISPHNPDAGNKLAMIYLEQGRIEKAKTILVDLVERIPSFANARLNLGIVYYKEKDVLAARKEFRAVLDLVDQKSDEARLARGYLDLIE